MGSAQFSAGFLRGHRLLRTSQLLRSSLNKWKFSSSASVRQCDFLEQFDLEVQQLRTVCLCHVSSVFF